MKLFTKKEELILLAVFRLGDNACLVTIREQLKEMTGRSFSIGTIYAPLSRLHEYGYLGLRKDLPANSLSSKRIQYYRLTSRGNRTLADLKRQTDRMWDGIEPVLRDKKAER